MARTIGRRKITVTIGAGPTPISPINLFTTDFDFFFPQANGAAFEYIGDSTVDATWIPRRKNVVYNFVHGSGTLDGSQPVVSFNLHKIFVTGNPGDTCIVEYMAFDPLVN